MVSKRKTKKAKARAARQTAMPPSAPPSFPIPSQPPKEKSPASEILPERHNSLDWTRFIANPAWPALISAGVTVSDAGNILVKSYTLLAMWLWLNLDLWFMSRKWHWKEEWKRIFFASSSGILAIIMLSTVKWFVQLKIDEQQTNTFSKLTASMYLPPNGDVLTSEVTVNNGGSIRLSGHKIFCGVNHLKTAGNFDMAGVGIYTKSDGTGAMVIGPPDNIPLETFPIESGGDAQTAFCIPRNVENKSGPVTCADITVIFFYSIETQPTAVKSKRFRFVFRSKDGTVRWAPQSVDYEFRYC